MSNLLNMKRKQGVQRKLGGSNPLNWRVVQNCLSMAWLFIVVIVMGLDTRNNCELLGTAKKMRPKRKRSVQVMQDDKDVYMNEV